MSFVPEGLLSDALPMCWDNFLVWKEMVANIYDSHSRHLAEIRF